MSLAPVPTVWEAFAAQVGRDPAAPAVRGTVALSYGELAERAGEVAAALAGGSRPGAVVALDATEPAAGAVAVLAAAKARRTLLPLNPESPPLHRAAILADANPALTLRGAGDAVLAVEPTGAAKESVAPPDAAHIMYTSGSTGWPKGVVVTHQALLARLRGLAAAPGVGPGDSFLAMTALSFDPCLAELLVPLVVGGQVVAAPGGARLDPATFAAVVAGQRPTVVQATPSFWRLALAWGWTGVPGMRVWCGGEPLTPGLAADLLATGAELWNVYGPTEATIWATAQRVRTPDAIGLGRPLAGTGLCLERDGRPVTGAGEPGEILLYGECLAAGYLRRPDLTARQFGTRETPEGPPAVLPDRRPGPVPGRRPAGLPRPRRLAGQAARPPDRAGRGGGGPGAAPGSARGGRRAARRRPARPRAPRRLPHRRRQRDRPGGAHVAGRAAARPDAAQPAVVPVRAAADVDREGRPPRAGRRGRGGGGG